MRKTMLTQRSKDMERLMTALELCCKLHADQTDKCGQPYWIHPFTVAMRGFTGYGNKQSISYAIVFYTFGGCNDIFEVGIWFEEKSQDFIDTIFSVFSSLFCLLGIDRIKISSITRRYNNLW